MEKLLKNIHWIIIAVAVYNFYSFYIQEEEDLANLSTQEESQRVQLAQNKKAQREITNYYKNINEEKEKIESVAKEIEKTQQMLPSEISDLENINLIRRMAEDVNIDELSITPETDVEQGFFIARRYKLQAKATFLQFLILLEKISENKRILNIGESSLKKIDKVQRGKFQIIEGEFILKAYRFNPNYKEDRGIEDVQKKFEEDLKTAPGEKRTPRIKKAQGEEV